MNEFSNTSKFDCLKLDARLVPSEATDDVVFLHSLYLHLEQLCEVETDRLEDLATRISWATETALAYSERQRMTQEVDEHFNVIDAPLDAIFEMADRASRRLLDIKRRVEIGERYKVPVHIFGSTKAIHGGKDLELIELEMIELQIQNYLAQMDELETEIATATPKTVDGVMLKLEFMSGLAKDGSSFATDVLGFVVDQSAAQLRQLLDLPFVATGRAPKKV